MARIRTALRSLDPNLTVREFVTFQDLVDKGVSSLRFLVLLLAGFVTFAEDAGRPFVRDYDGRTHHIVIGALLVTVADRLGVYSRAESIPD